MAFCGLQYEGTAAIKKSQNFTERVAQPPENKTSHNNTLQFLAMQNLVNKFHFVIQQ